MPYYIVKNLHVCFIPSRQQAPWEQVLSPVDLCVSSSQNSSSLHSRCPINKHELNWVHTHTNPTYFLPFQNMAPVLTALLEGNQSNSPSFSPTSSNCWQHWTVQKHDFVAKQTWAQIVAQLLISCVILGTLPNLSKHQFLPL